MILGYDAERQELTVDLEDGRPTFEVRVDRLILKHYGDVGILFADMEGDRLTVGLLTVKGENGCIKVTPVGPNTWRVNLSLA